jgi:hypothetical protein
MVVDARWRIWRVDGDVSGFDGGTGFRAIIERPSRDLFRESAGDEVDEASEAPDAGCGGEPELVEAGRLGPFRPVRGELDLAPPARRGGTNDLRRELKRSPARIGPRTCFALAARPCCGDARELS